jgi:hypothetical protein
MKTKLLLLVTTICFVHFSFSQNETKNWKQFTNKDYQFSINYPEYCSEISEKDSIPKNRKKQLENLGRLSYSSKLKKYSLTFENKVVPIFSLTIYDNPENLLLKDFIYKIVIDNKNIYKTSDISFEAYKFSNQAALITKYENRMEVIQVAIRNYLYKEEMIFIEFNSLII